MQVMLNCRRCLRVYETMMTSGFWNTPRDWIGERVFILGGGPSLKSHDLRTIDGRGKVIAINDAFLLRNDADVLYFADARWWEWNSSDVDANYTGDCIISRSCCYPSRAFKQVHWIGRDVRNPLSDHRQYVSGWCSGSNAINLAYLRGATEIVLLGFDMHGGNWHSRHKAEKKPNCYEIDFIPYLERMSVVLKSKGIDVINVNKESALKCFRFATLTEVLHSKEGTQDDEQ
jgi:hypothetical protein